MHIAPAAGIPFLVSLSSIITPWLGSFSAKYKSIDDKKFITHFEEPYKDIKLRFYQCIGNHDYGTIYFNHVVPNDYKHQIEYTKKSKKWYLPKRYYHYSKKLGNLKVDFFVLDTNIDLMKKEEIIQERIIQLLIYYMNH